jgi:hypothetical protein
MEGQEGLYSIRVLFFSNLYYGRLFFILMGPEIDLFFPSSPYTLNGYLYFSSLEMQYLKTKLIQQFVIYLIPMF